MERVRTRGASAVRGFGTLVLVAGLTADQLELLHSVGRHALRHTLEWFTPWIVVTAAGMTVVHELGHLVAAWILRMRVTRVSLLGRRSRDGVPHVAVDPDPGGRWLPARFVVTMLAGPLANVTVAGICLLFAERPGAAPAEKAFLLVPVILGGLGLLNLVPVDLYRGGFRSDGAQILRWATRPEEARAALAARRALPRARAALSHGEAPDLAGLRDIVDGGDPVTAGPAALILLTGSARSGQLAHDADRLARLAGSERLAPSTAGTIAATLAWLLANEALAGFLKTRVAPDRGRMDELAALAELARARAPESSQARCALALVHCLRERPEAARDLLVTSELSPVGAADQANNYAVRALAELLLDNPTRARSLIQAASAQGQQPRVLTLVRLLVDAADGAPRG